MRRPHLAPHASSALVAALLLAACVSAGAPRPSATGGQLPPLTSAPSATTPSAAGSSAAAPSSHPASPAPTGWGHTIDRLIGARQVSVAVREGSTLIYGHLADTRRAPASNEKLLLSMTALSDLGPDYRIPTDAAVAPKALQHGVVHGDLWIVGHGDPEFGDAGVATLAANIRAAGVRRITGAVLGDTGGFVRDRHAPGWHALALQNVGLPTALSFDHNISPSGFVMVPELRAAQALTVALRHEGIRVGSKPRADAPTGSLHTVATVRSAPLAGILHRQNITSDNTDAETLNKLLGATFGGAGSIADGAAVIQGWVHEHGVEARVLDASGLSYGDRISPLDLTGLLASALHKPWGDALRASLPHPGQGTLVSRLSGVPVQAKTGTLTLGISALSGYVRLHSGKTATFSILSRGITKDDAIRIEDAIVRILAARA